MRSRLSKRMPTTLIITSRSITRISMNRHSQSILIQHPHSRNIPPIILTHSTRVIQLQPMLNTSHRVTPRRRYRQTLSLRTNQKPPITTRTRSTSLINTHITRHTTHGRTLIRRRFHHTRMSINTTNTTNTSHPRSITLPVTLILSTRKSLQRPHILLRRHITNRPRLHTRSVLLRPRTAPRTR